MYLVISADMEVHSFKSVRREQQKAAPWNELSLLFSPSSRMAWPYKRALHFTLGIIIAFLCFFLYRLSAFTDEEKYMMTMKRQVVFI